MPEQVRQALCCLTAARTNPFLSEAHFETNAFKWKPVIYAGIARETYSCLPTWILTIQNSWVYSKVFQFEVYLILAFRMKIILVLFWGQTPTFSPWVPKFSHSVLYFLAVFPVSLSRPVLPPLHNALATFSLCSSYRRQTFESVLPTSHFSQPSLVAERHKARNILGNGNPVYTS